MPEFAHITRPVEAQQAKKLVAASFRVCLVRGRGCTGVQWMQPNASELLAPERQLLPGSPYAHGMSLEEQLRAFLCLDPLHKARSVT